MNKQLSRAERIEVYRKARKIYQHQWKMPLISNQSRMGNVACLGLCSPIFEALLDLGYDPKYNDLNRKNFPEWFSYKPKTGWKKNPLFWWTISDKKGGTAKRKKILERLAVGKSKGE